MRSAETEAAAISIATARIPTGRDVAWVSACLESAEERGIKFVIAARSRREAGGGLRNQLRMRVPSLSLYLTLQLAAFVCASMASADCRHLAKVSSSGVFCARGHLASGLRESVASTRGL